MTSNTTEAKILLSAEDRATETVRKFRAEVDQLGKSIAKIGRIEVKGIPTRAGASTGENIVKAQADAMRALRNRFAFQARMDRQRTSEANAEQRERRAIDAAATKGLRERMALATRLNRQKAAEQRVVERDRQRADIAGMRAFRERMAFATRMGRQKLAEQKSADREQQRADMTGMRALRQRMAFATRMGRQQAAEQRAAERDRQRADAQAERAAASATRRQAADIRYLFNLRQRHERQERQDRERDRRRITGHARDAWGHGKDAYRDTTRPLAATAIAGTAGAAAAARKILRVEGDIDAAEVNARIYGGLSQDAARKLRDQWAAPLAEALGTGTDKLLSSYTDALKLGIPNAGAQAFSELATQTSEAWSVPFESVTDILGTVNSILTSKGDPFDFAKLKGTANAIQHLAAKQSTTPEKLMSFLQRGAGAAQVLGMSQEAGLAFGSASTSLGNQAGQSGRMFDYLASRLIEMPRLTRQRGEDGRQARDLVKALGYDSAEQMDARRRASPDEFLPDFMNRFNRIKDPRQQDRAIRFFTGREWLGEFGRMVKGIDTYREAVKLAKESKGLDAIGVVWTLHKTKLSFVMKQFTAGFRNILGEFGKELSPVARQAGDYFLAWTTKLRNGGLAARFKAAIGGFIEGLGFENLPALLEGIFGKPGEGNAGSIQAWANAARGFGAGLRDVGTAIRSFFEVFTGKNASPETIGRWTARILGFAAVLFIASPAISILGGLALGILAFVRVVQAAHGILKGLGLAGGGGAGPGASPRAPAGRAGLLGRLLRLAPAIAAPLTMDEGQESRNERMMRLGEWAKRRNKGNATDATPAEPEADALRDALRSIDPDLAKRLFPEVEKPRPEKQSSRDEWRGLIQPASFDSVGDLTDALDNLTRTLNVARQAGMSDQTRAALQSITGRGDAAGGGGQGLGGTASTFVPPTPSVPGWFGKGRGGGEAGGSNSSGGGSAPRGDGTGTRGPANTGRMMAWAMDQLRREGVPEASLKRAAAHLVGQATMESGLDPNKVHDHGTGYGIYGARDPNGRTGRRSAMLAWLAANGYARNSAEGQMRFMAKEAMSGRFKQTKRILMGETTGSLDGDTNAITEEFESPKVVNRRSHAVQGALNVGPQGDGGGSDGGGGPVNQGATGNVMAQMRALRASGRVLNEQCVSLAKAAVGANGSVRDWRKGVAAAEGTLKAGTPIATFLNRDGSPSSRYAGGGTGTPGAGLDHAGVFQEYLRDEGGKIIGMRVAEQYKGSGGVRSKDYMFGRGRGEHNGSNYHAVLGPDGQPLGGDRNPMSARAAAALTAGWQKRAGGNAKTLGINPKAAQAARAALNPTPPTIAAADGTGVKIAAAAASKVGWHEEKDEQSLKSWIGSEVKGDLNPWCATFVNAALREAGVKGTGSKLAASFTKWGEQVPLDQVQAGDVLHRDKAFGRSGHDHVAVATGQTRTLLGKQQLEMYSGNDGDQVQKLWYDADGFTARRHTQPGAAKRMLMPSPKAAAAAAVKPAADPAALADRAPDPWTRPPGMGDRAGNTSTTHNNVTIHAGNQSPAELAGHFQRHIEDRWNYRSHDLEPELT